MAPSPIELRVLAKASSDIPTTMTDEKSNRSELPDPAFISIKVIVEQGGEHDQFSLTHILSLSAIRMPAFRASFVLNVIDIAARGIVGLGVTDPAVQLLVDRLRACGLPEHLPHTEPIGDTSIGSTNASVLVEWNDKRFSFVVSQQASGYTGADASSVAAFFVSLITLAGIPEDGFLAHRLPCAR